tara:strand:- start:1218 stop:1430 length:213 start_codon:yes stop_codon:yes gene_type:complete
MNTFLLLTLLLLTYLLVRLYRFIRKVENINKKWIRRRSNFSENNIVKEKEKNTKVDYSKVRDADFEDLDE